MATKKGDGVPITSTVVVLFGLFIVLQYPYSQEAK
jgi:hypothetical protein